MCNFNPPAAAAVLHILGSLVFFFFFQWGEVGGEGSGFIWESTRDKRNPVCLLCLIDAEGKSVWTQVSERITGREQQLENEAAD